MGNLDIGELNNSVVLTAGEKDFLALNSVSFPSTLSFDYFSLSHRAACRVTRDQQGTLSFPGHFSASHVISLGNSSDLIRLGLVVFYRRRISHLLLSGGFLTHHNESLSWSFKHRLLSKFQGTLDAVSSQWLVGAVRSFLQNNCNCKPTENRQK